MAFLVELGSIIQGGGNPVCLSRLVGLIKFLIPITKKIGRSGSKASIWPPLYIPIIVVVSSLEQGTSPTTTKKIISNLLEEHKMFGSVQNLHIKFSSKK